MTGKIEEIDRLSDNTGMVGDVPESGTDSPRPWDKVSQTLGQSEKRRVLKSAESFYEVSVARINKTQTVLPTLYTCRLHFLTP